MKLRLTAEETLLDALIDIMTFKPKDDGTDPYQQIAAHSKSTAQNAYSAWKTNSYVPKPK